MFLPAIRTCSLPAQHLLYLHYRVGCLPMGYIQTHEARSITRWVLVHIIGEPSHILIRKKDAHGHNLGSHAAHGPETDHGKSGQIDSQKSVDIEQAVPEPKHAHGHGFEDTISTQIIGVGILEFGVVLHR